MQATIFGETHKIFFGNKSVKDLVKDILEIWPGEFKVDTKDDGKHESNLLHLKIDKSYKYLNWKPKWGYNTTLEKTIKWYMKQNQNYSAYKCCMDDINSYNLS